MTQKERYQAKKEALRESAKSYQKSFSYCSYNYLELAKFSHYFTTYGKRYGLIKEFRENGII